MNKGEICRTRGENLIADSPISHLLFKWVCSWIRVLMHQQMPQHLLLCLVVDAAAGMVGNARLISYKELSWCRLLPLMKVSPSLNSCCLLDIPAAICSASLQPVWGVRADASAFCWCHCLSVFTQQNGWRMVGSHLSVADSDGFRQSGHGIGCLKIMTYSHAGTIWYPIFYQQVAVKSIC